MGKRNIGPAGSSAGFLHGLPLAVIVFTQWWLAEDRVEEETLKVEDKKKKPTRQRSVGDRADVFSKLRVTSQHQMIAAGSPGRHVATDSRAQLRGCDGNGRMSCITAETLARVDLILCRGDGRGDSTTLVVHVE